MQRLGDFFFRLIGPILFSAAFLLFVSNYNVVKQYLDTVKSGFVEGEVYEQSNVDTNDRIYKFKSDGSYEVDGSYMEKSSFHLHRNPLWCTWWMRL